MSEERLARARDVGQPWSTVRLGVVAETMVKELLCHIDAIEAELTEVTEAGLRLVGEIEAMRKDLAALGAEMTKLLEQARALASD